MKILTLVTLLFCSAATTALSEGDTAPSFSLPILGEQQIVSLSELRGKIVYLDFWASWCGPCRISLPQMVVLQEELGSDQFEVIAINLDEDQEQGSRFLKRYPVNYTVLTDPEGKVAEIYQLPGMPSSFVIDQAGIISLAHTGFRRGDMSIIRNHIEVLLDQDD